VVEGLLRPAQQLIALLVAGELQLGVDPEGVTTGEHIGDDRMVDDQLGGDQRVDLLRITAEGGHRIAHCH
jgi:hypothetical protein